MEIVLEKDEFLKSLQKIQGLVERKVTMPILSHCLIETREDRILITATDLEILMYTETKCKIKKSGQLAAPARKLFEIVRDLPEDNLNLRWKEGYFLEITSGKSLFRISALPADEFPKLSIETEEHVGLKSELIKRLIDRTFFAISTDETRPNLNGIYFEILKPDILRAVGTDGHRLSYHEERVDEEKLKRLLLFSSKKNGIIIPRKGVQEIRRLIADEEEIQISLRPTGIRIATGQTTLLVRSLDAEFPEYKQVIPKENNNRARIKRQQALEAIKRVSIISTERTKAIKFEFRDKNLKISSVNPDVGEAEEEIDIEYTGEKIIIAFNAKYIIDVLERSETEDFLMEMKDELSPTLIRFTGEDNNLNIIMPMRI